MTSRTKISQLMDDLSSNDGISRIRARQALVSRGNDALMPLTLLLLTGKYWERWEAAKALGQMKNPLAIKGLIKALRDEKFEIRWLAAEGLITMGTVVLKPLAEALIDTPDSVLLQQSAHHVLKGVGSTITSEYIDVLLEALESYDPAVEVPFAASSVLEASIP